MERINGEHGVLECQQATQAQAQHRKRNGGDGRDQLYTGPQNAHDHFSAVNRGSHHVVYFALQHHVVELMSQVCQRYDMGDGFLRCRPWVLRFDLPG
ncbi:hypothetical protein [Pseudomonas antarctica]|uniref:hypothetical protein n=1 Tax=Pseudomonas antarctica TaxID=219572 RepID=UPI0013EF54DD|nr:hypothetical protein [Pseudomonas antarctica]